MTAPLRVLHAHSGNLFGGIERVLVTLAEVSDEHSFALCFGGRLEDELRATGVAVHIVGEVKFSRPLSLLGARRRFSVVLGESDPDIVLCHSTWAHSVFAPVVRTAGKPLAFWLHAPPTGQHWLERLARRRPPDVVIVNSEWTRQSVGLLFSGMPTEVVYPPVTEGGRGRAGAGEGGPVDTGRGRARAGEGGPNTGLPAREAGRLQRTCIIIMVARMEEEKGHAVLVEALGELGVDREWECWFVGGAVGAEQEAYLTRLESRAEELGIAERVRFMGERRDVPHLLAAADLFCHPNTRPEGFGVVFIEALYAGLPVIASSSGGTLEIVDESCGVLIKPGDADELAKTLARLVTDREARAALGKNGPARAKELCDAGRQNGRLVDLLGRAVRDGEGR